MVRTKKFQGAWLGEMRVPFATILSFLTFFLSGGHVSLSPIVLVDVLGLKRLTTSFGLMTLSRGVATLVGPIIGGL